MNTKLQVHTTRTDDALVNVARTIGSALGTIAAKISTTAKSTRRRKKPLKARVATRAKAVSATKARSKPRS